MTTGTESDQNTYKKLNTQICRKSEFNYVLENTLVSYCFINGNGIFVSIQNFMKIAFQTKIKNEFS